MDNFWNGRTVLVTGAGGFTGQHLAAALHELGARVMAFVRKDGTPTELDPADPDIEVFAGDLVSRDDCRRAMQGVDTVFHLAAVFRRFSATAEQMRHIHVDATGHLLREAARSGVRRFVHTSTIGVHGGLQVDRVDETGALRPSDDYQLSKLQGEQLASRLAPELGLPFSIVRPCSIYGPGDTRFLKFIKPMSLGLFVMIGPGDVHVHFVYIDDLTQGLLLAGEKEAALGETFIIGEAKSYSLNEFARIVANLVGVRGPRFRIPVGPVQAASKACKTVFDALHLEPPLHPRRVGFFTKHRSFSIDKARRLLGYEPKTDLETGLRKQIAWLRKQGNL